MTYLLSKTLISSNFFHIIYDLCGGFVLSNLNNLSMLYDPHSLHDLNSLYELIILQELSSLCDQPNTNDLYICKDLHTLYNLITSVALEVSMTYITL